MSNNGGILLDASRVAPEKVDTLTTLAQPTISGTTNREVAMTTKCCDKCGAVKPLSEFYAHPHYSDGLMRTCKACKRAYQTMRRRYGVPTGRKMFATQAERDAAMREYRRNYVNHNREKINAHQAMHRAVRSGAIRRAEQCEACGKMGPTHGHHKDYTKQLDVVWLCTRCHVAVHREGLGV